MTESLVTSMYKRARCVRDLADSAFTVKKAAYLELVRTAILSELTEEKFSMSENGWMVNRVDCEDMSFNDFTEAIRTVLAVINGAQPTEYPLYYHLEARDEHRYVHLKYGHVHEGDDGTLPRSSLCRLVQDKRKAHYDTIKAANAAHEEEVTSVLRPHIKATLAPEKYDTEKECWHIPRPDKDIVEREYDFNNALNRILLQINAEDTTVPSLRVECEYGEKPRVKFDM